MKIVVLDGYTLNPGDLSWEKLEALGKLTVYDRTPIDDNDLIIKRIGDAEAVFVNKTPIRRETIESCSNLRYIGVTATGYNIVDTLAAKEKGISVTNVPSYGTMAVGQFAIALLLEICHHVGHHNESVHQGVWSSKLDYSYWDYPLIELADKTMGIIGFGRIGQQTGRIAKALGMKILAYDTNVTESGKEIADYVSLDELLSQSDVISLHCPLFPATQGIINQDTIRKMKDGVILINNSRGQLVVEQDLADALNEGKIFAAGLDVVSYEPIKQDNPLLKAKNCIMTPHISWAPIESRSRLMNTAIDNLIHFLDGNPINVVKG